MNPETGKYIKVSEFEKAEATEQWDNELSCLITSNNTIPIGEYTFWIGRIKFIEYSLITI